ncbi:uncharacterized protein BT62DRAFT_457518 [Guyanagaster necrorhizus]|uniref:Uncharacterized protein n=1 Tax=Guyanagaster necrorhizus TaxID=856835 RepID=A0A9P7VLI3_9AGAR|nr:uncharacterized protein BT62DRAFT_457518 [Guyanagaster necrorhizus MCA 3950]KAG7442109.1 hypothetical protein BT62DRAFT_457518 [Guyanagaster necrorhizus MCA 3950]
MSTLPSSTLAEGTDTALSGAYKLTGPLLIGCFLNLILYGVLCTQVYIYYISFPKDRLASKGIVYVLWFTETLQTILNAYVIFDIFCFDFGNFPALDKVNLTWFSVPILSGLIGCISQLFYAWRMYAFSKKAPWLSMILSVIAFTQFAGAIACGIQARRYGYFSDLYAKAKVPILVSKSSLCLPFYRLLAGVVECERFV